MNMVIPNNVTVASTPWDSVVAVDTEIPHAPDFIVFDDIISADEIYAIPTTIAAIYHNIMNLSITNRIEAGSTANHNPIAKRRLPRNDVLEFTIADGDVRGIFQID